MTCNSPRSKPTPLFPLQLGDEGVGEDKTDETSNQLSEVCIEDEVICPSSRCFVEEGGDSMKDADGCCIPEWVNYLIDGTLVCCKDGPIYMDYTDDPLFGMGVCPD